jgi:hypothetical protein
VSNILENLQQRRRREIVLESGLKVGYHLPDIEELIVKVGQIPSGAVQAAQQVAGEELTEETALQAIVTNPDIAMQGYRYTLLLVAAMLDDIDGEPIDPTDDREAIVKALDPADRRELFLIGSREKDPDSGEA